MNATEFCRVEGEDPACMEFAPRVSLWRRSGCEPIAGAIEFLCPPLAGETRGQILGPDYGAGMGNRL